MSRKTGIWLAVAACLILTGCIIFGGVMTVFRWDFTGLSTAKYETNRYGINERFQNITVVTKTAHVSVVPSDGPEVSVVCYEREKVKHSVAVTDNTLVVQVVDTRKWYEYIGIFFGSPKITVYIPQGQYGALTVTSSTGNVEIAEDFLFESIAVTESTGHVTNRASASKDIKIRTSTGDIRLENVSAASVDLSVSTGKIAANAITCTSEMTVSVSTGRADIRDVVCQSLTSDGSTGDVHLKNVIASQKLSVTRSTGDVELDGCDAAQMLLKTSTGDVEGSLLTDKVFVVKTGTGHVDVPGTTTGGICQISTSTGDVEISIR